MHSLPEGTGVGFLLYLFLSFLSFLLPSLATETLGPI